MHWWEYYKFSKEPKLSLSPLLLKDELKIYHGREDELQLIRTRCDSENRISYLLTGDAGIGKTSYICKAFQNEKGLIRVDLKKAPILEMIESEIAKACIGVLKRNNQKSDDLETQLKHVVTHTTGHSLKVSPVNIGADSINQKTKTANPEYILSEIIQEAIDRLTNSGERIILFLDECDFGDVDNPHYLCSLCERLKEMIHDPGILVLANRDDAESFYGEYCDSSSIVRATFDFYQNLKPLWKIGKDGVKEILNYRFETGSPSAVYVFPFSNEAYFWIDVLSSGNYREMLRYTKDILQSGFQQNIQVPFDQDFVKKSLIEHFPEHRLSNEKDINVLNYLKETPTHISDKDFQKLESRTSLQRRLKKLEKLWLITRDTDIIGKKQTYSITQKADLLIGLIE